jgi:transcriptional regulator with XRE-family HTH domain
MNEISQLVRTLKERLKTQGMSYRDLAKALRLSEASVKRLFATERFSLERIVEIANLLGYTLAELAQDAAVAGNRLHTLTEAQEKEVVSDTKLLLVAVCVLNQWKIENIVERYRLTEAECIQQLARLDRLRLITLLPGNRVRLNVARDFDWLPHGPIRAYFQEQGLGDFLAGDFARDDEVLAFSHAMLTGPAMTRMRTEIRRLRQRFSELHEESLTAPLFRRTGTGLLLAMREWEIEAFTQLRRRNE